MKNVQDLLALYIQVFTLANVLLPYKYIALIIPCLNTIHVVCSSRPNTCHLVKGTKVGLAGVKDVTSLRGIWDSIDKDICEDVGQ